MKITKAPKTWTKKMLCPKAKGGPEGCGTRFAIEAEDVCFAVDTGAYYVPCPTCGLNLAVTGQLRLDIRKAAERRFRKATSTTTTGDAVIA